jgi:Tfp pilus assembly protein PilX
MDIRREDGIALIVALMATLLMTALGVALILTTSTETMITANYRNGQEALYAADAALERAMDDILTVPDWNNLLNGSTQSAFIDGSPSGTRTMPDGTQIDLSQLVNLSNCGKTTSCSASDLTANLTGDRPWGANNPVWQLYAYNRLDAMVPSGTINSQYYVVVLVADDPSDNDDDPLHDGLAPANGQPSNLGLGVVSLRAEAFGPRGAHKVIQMTVARTDTTNLERGYTGQRGQDEQNRRARKAAVQTPGKTLTQQTMGLSTGGIH